MFFIMAGDLGGGRTNGSVVSLQPFEGLFFQAAGEELFFQGIQLTRYIVFLVKIGIVEYLCENFFGEDVLDKLSRTSA